jgi:aminoglycoside phosphotransferase (APT) family kinase protein
VTSPPSRPPHETLAWVERTLGRDARVVDAQRLTGGLTSWVHALTVEQHGRRTSYVVRWWDVGADHAVDAVRSEAAVLTALAHSELPAPRLRDTTLDVADRGPALLMTRLPGHVHLVPRDREHWLQQMATMLARVHALDVPGKPFESWLDPHTLVPPSDATRPAIWREAVALVAAEPPATHTCFIHRDYQHFNLLWSNEQLTGVVDWIEACIGPAAVDVGHCRLNLALLFSADVAERFRELYEAEAGRTVDPWWDVHALLSFGPDWKHFLPIQIDGRASLDIDGMTSRIEDLLARALKRR